MHIKIALIGISESGKTQYWTNLREKYIHPIKGDERTTADIWLECSNEREKANRDGRDKPNIDRTEKFDPPHPLYLSESLTVFIGDPPGDYFLKLSEVSKDAPKKKKTGDTYDRKQPSYEPRTFDRKFADYLEESNGYIFFIDINDKRKREIYACVCNVLDYLYRQPHKQTQRRYKWGPYLKDRFAFVVTNFDICRHPDMLEITPFTGRSEEIFNTEIARRIFGTVAGKQTIAKIEGICKKGNYDYFVVSSVRTEFTNPINGVPCQISDKNGIIFIRPFNFVTDNILERLESRSKHI